MDVFDRLEHVIASRREAGADGSYVAKLQHDGIPTIARKLGEEAVEAIVAALSSDRDALTSEAADLIFHLLILLEARGVSIADVRAELARREGVSGITEKAARKG